MDNTIFRRHLKQIIELEETTLGSNTGQSTDQNQKNLEKKSEKNLENLNQEEKEDLEDIEELGDVLDNLATH